MTYHFKALLLVTSTLLTGLLAGVFFTWTNAVTPGLAMLDDLHYLKAFQHMNRAIINPLFYVVIVGPLFLLPLTAWFYRSAHTEMKGLLIAAAVIYYTGVFAVTMLGNIPLNLQLEKALLETFNAQDAHLLRAQFESKWDALHLLRTVTSAISFMLLLIASILIPHNNKKTSFT